MVLLGTPERPILLSAAAALASYGERAPENLERLTTSSSSASFDLDVVGSVLKLVGNEDLVTRRCAWMGIFSGCYIEVFFVRSDFFL